MALAQDVPEETAWPSADELRADLQAIGYGFTFDGSGRARHSEFRPDLPALWTLTEPALAGDDVPDGSGLEPFTLQLIDDGSGTVQLLFAGTSADDGDGEFETIATTLMEIGSRLPEGNGLDEAVWFLGNKWQAAADRSAAPCTYRESEDGSMLVWFGGEGEDITSFFGTVGTAVVLPDELQLCKDALSQPQPPEPEASETARHSVGRRQCPTRRGRGHHRSRHPHHHRRAHAGRIRAGSHRGRAQHRRGSDPISVSGSRSSIPTNRTCSTAAPDAAATSLPSRWRRLASPTSPMRPASPIWPERAPRSSRAGVDRPPRLPILERSMIGSHCRPGEP